MSKRNDCGHEKGPFHPTVSEIEDVTGVGDKSSVQNWLHRH